MKIFLFRNELCKRLALMRLSLLKCQMNQKDYFLYLRRALLSTVIRFIENPYISFNVLKRMISGKPNMGSVMVEVINYKFLVLLRSMPALRSTPALRSNPLLRSWPDLLSLI